ncbi:MAG: formyltransferase family protein, partial [Psychrobacter sp.]
MSDNTNIVSPSNTQPSSTSPNTPTTAAIDTATLLIKCKDQAGIVQAVSEFIHRYGANIITLDQYSTAHEGGQYFMRLEFALAGLSDIIDNFKASFAHTVAKRHNMDWRLHNNAIKTKVGILVSKFDHALLDLLWRHQRGLLDCDITCVVSNHPDLRQAVENFGITFHHVPVSKANKAEAEEQIHELMAGNDLLVLARYMQILSSDFVKRWPMKVIN